MTETEDILRISIYGSFALFAVLSSSLVFFVMAFKRKKQAFKAERELLEERFRSSLAESKLEISEQTLKDVAREIHDGIGQRVTYAIQALERETSAKEDVRDTLLEVITDLRNLSRSLHTSHIQEMGLDLAAEKECQVTEKLTGIKCTYTPPEGMINVSPQAEIILFRCLQEALQNAVKYAECSEIQVRLSTLEAHLELVIKDNGQGFDTANTERGIGTRSMHERVEMFKGDLQLLSEIGKGTEVRITLPYHESSS
jgi:hypothetical protein